MADTNAMADIRGLNISKLARGFADELLVMKKLVNVTKTKNREIRWYKKTAGFLDSVDTSGITASQIANTSFKARPFVVEQSWTRTSSYVKKFMVESPLISLEDIKDSDVNILATNVRDLVRAVGYQVDISIYDAITDDSDRQTGASTQDGWDDTATGNPILDLLTMAQAIRSYGYDPKGAVVLMNSIEHKHLINYLISVKGSSVPYTASKLVESGVLMELLGFKIVVSEIATTDEVTMFTKDACTWYQFEPIQTAIIDEPGIGKKVRVWEEGIAVVTDPKAIYKLTDTITG